jgi:chromosome segregation ATPase
MSRFLAESLSQTDKQWLPLQNELLSSATPIGTIWKQPSQIGIADAVRAYRDQKPQVIVSSVSIKELEQLRAAQTALTEQQARAQELNTQLNDARSLREQSSAQLKDTQEQLKDSQESLKGRQEEAELLLAQLHQVQEELEKYFLEHQDAKHELEQLRAEQSAMTELQARVHELNTQLNDARTQREHSAAQ